VKVIVEEKVKEPLLFPKNRKQDLWGNVRVETVVVRWD
jgi:hypothetical protein